VKLKNKKLRLRWDSKKVHVKMLHVLIYRFTEYNCLSKKSWRNACCPLVGII